MSDSDTDNSMEEVPNDQTIEEVSSDEDDSDEEQEGDAVDSTGGMSFDLGILAAFDTSELDAKQLQKNTDTYMLEQATIGTQKLIKQIFDLPTQAKPNIRGWIASLPQTKIVLPREKPMPKAKAQTKWEKFAIEKGIKKRKRSVKVFDERTETWKRSHGYDKANDESKDWVIEHKQKIAPMVDDGSVQDPWTTMRQEKKKRIEKNTKHQKRNLDAAAGKRAPGTIDLTTAVVSAPSKQKKNAKAKHHVDLALGLTQRSTASMGVHDKLRASESAPKAFKAAKRDSELERSFTEERTQSLSVLDRLLGKPSEAEQLNFSQYSRKGRKGGGKGGGKGRKKQ